MKKHLLLFVVILFVVLIFSLPLFLSAVNGTGPAFSGVHTFVNAADSFFQLEVVHQGANSVSWLAENPYSTEGPAVQRFLIFYTLMGKLARWTGLNWLWIYQLNRILWAALFICILFWFIGLFGFRNKTRIYLLLLVLFSGGLGAAIWPEGNLFLSLYNPPHVSFSLCLILIVMGCFKEGTKENSEFGIRNSELDSIKSIPQSAFRIPHSNNTRHSSLVTHHSIALLVASVSLFILGWVHPYDVFALDIILAAACVYLWYRTRENRIFTGLAILLAAGLLPLVFHFYWSYAHFTGHNFVIDDYAVPFYSLPAFLGLNFIVVMLLGFWNRITGRDACATVQERTDSLFKDYWFLWIWLIVGLAMLFVPFYFRRKLFLGVPIAINLLAGIYIINIFQKPGDKIWLKRIMPVFVAGYLVLASWGNVGIVSADMRGMLGKQFPYFIAGEKMAAFRYLKEGTTLCHPDNGMLIPVYSGQKVYAANWLWTSDLGRKKTMIKKFFLRDTCDCWRREFLKSNNIDYLYYGQWERNLGGFNPDGAGYLKKVFDNGAVRVYSIPKK
ncbi:hypothetical protein ACFL57_04030 [Candidatus Margulisiibacteriota bacterium]